MAVETCYFHLFRSVFVAFRIAPLNQMLLWVFVMDCCLLSLTIMNNFSHLLVCNRINAISWPAIFCVYRFVLGNRFGREYFKFETWTNCFGRRFVLRSGMLKPEDSMDTGDTGENSVRFNVIWNNECCWVRKRLRHYISKNCQE